MWQVLLFNWTPALWSCGLTKEQQYLRNAFVRPLVKQVLKCVESFGQLRNSSLSTLQRSVLAESPMLPFLRRHVYRTILAALVILTTSTPGVAQITSTPALPVTRGHGIVRVQTKLLRATDTIGTTSRSLTVISAPVVGVYGVTPKLAVFGVVPFLSKRLETTTPGNRVERDSADLEMYVCLPATRLFSRTLAAERFV